MKLVSTILALFILTSCATNFESAVLRADGVTFASLDGQSSVNYNQEFIMPAGSPPSCFEHKTKQYQGGSIFKHGIPLESQFLVAKENGGSYYKINVQGKHKTLYGLLLLCSTQKRKGLGKNIKTIANITLPENVQTSALQGETAVVRRVVKEVNELTIYSWLLWVADDLDKIS